MCIDEIIANKIFEDIINMSENDVKFLRDNFEKTIKQLDKIIEIKEREIKCQQQKKL